MTSVRNDVRYEVIDWGLTAQEDPDVVDRVFTRVMEGFRRGEFHRALPSYFPLHA